MTSRELSLEDRRKLIQDILDKDPADYNGVVIQYSQIDIEFLDEESKQAVGHIFFHDRNLTNTTRPFVAFNIVEKPDSSFSSIVESEKKKITEILV